MTGATPAEVLESSVLPDFESATAPYDGQPLNRYLRSDDQVVAHAQARSNENNKLHQAEIIQILDYHSTPGCVTGSCSEK
jgi:hypothetical protein